MESAVSSDSEGTKMMLQRLKKLRKRIPDLFDMDIISEKFPVTYENSLNNVLRLEVTRYNQLLGNYERLIYVFFTAVCVYTIYYNIFFPAHCSQSLSLLDKACKGETVMSVELVRIMP